MPTFRPIACSTLLAALFLPPLPARAEAPAGLTIAGEVAEAAAGLAGARVELWPLLPGGVSPERPAARAVTGRGGRFAVVAPGPGMFRVTVAAPGLPGLEWRLFPLLEAAELPPVDAAAAQAGPPRPFDPPSWTLSAAPAPRPRGGRPLAVRGSVVDAASRAPLAAALVWPEGDPGAFVPTDAAGRYELRWRDLGAPLVLHAAARGHRPVAVPLPRRPREGRATAPPLALVPTADVAGVVVDERGAPVAGAEIALDPESLPTERTAGLTGRTRSAAAGRFRLTGLTVGTSYRLIATHPAFAPTLTAAVAGRPLRLVLLRGRTASGRLVDGEGRPVAGARVTLHRGIPGAEFGRPDRAPLDEALYQARSTADGRFTLPRLAFRHADLSVRATGYLPLDVPVAPMPAPTSTPASPVATADLGDFVLTHGQAVFGRVTDPEGRPVAGVEIWDRDEEPGVPRVPATVSGADGDFEIPGADPQGGQYRVCREGYVEAALEWHAPPTGPLAPVLHPAARIEGRVVGPDGAPVAGALLSLSVPGQTGGDLILPPGPCPASPEWGVATDAEGRFTLSPVRAGWCDLAVQADGFLPARIPGHLHVAEGEAVTGVELRLATGASIAGHVRTPEGDPAGGVAVFASGRHGTARTLTAGDGSYLLTGVEIGSVSMRAEESQASVPAQVYQYLDVVPGANTLDLTLTRQARHEVRGRVVGPDGAPVAGVLLGPDEIPTEEDGSFSLRLEDGIYRLSAEREGLGRAAVDLVVQGADIADVLLRLEAGSSVSGRLLGLEPAELAGAQVAAHLGGLNYEHMAWVDRGGSYRVEGLPPGEWILTAFLGESKAEGRVTLASHATATLDLTFAERHPVRGRVTAPDGGPVDGATVTLRRGGIAVGETTTGPEGTFSLRAEDGAFALSAAAPGFVTGRLDPVEVTGGAVDGIEVALEAGAVLHGRVLGLAPGDPYRVEAAQGKDSRAFYGNDGTYRFEGLPAGAWQVTAALVEDPPVAPTHLTTRQVILPPGPAERSLDLPLSAGDLSLVVRLSRPLGADRLFLGSRRDGAIFLPTATAPDGLLHFTRLAPGSYWLQGQRGNEILAEQPVVLHADTEMTVELPPEAKP